VGGGVRRCRRDHAGRDGAGREGDVVWLFRQTILYAVYGAALVALGLHLYHGTWSMLRTLGVPLPARGPRRAGLTTTFTLLVTVRFVAILLAVAAGWLGPSG
jgi:succinate dehydrogenase / fumarate reductase cytochrome b subunit